MKRYCFYCGKKIDYKPREHFCSAECDVAHKREINREKQKRFIRSGKK